LTEKLGGTEGRAAFMAWDWDADDIDQDEMTEAMAACHAPDTGSRRNRMGDKGCTTNHAHDATKTNGSLHSETHPNQIG